MNQLATQDVTHPASTSYVTLPQIEQLLEKYIKKVGDYVVAQLLQKAHTDATNSMNMYYNHEDNWIPMEHDEHPIIPQDVDASVAAKEGNDEDNAATIGSGGGRIRYNS